MRFVTAAPFLALALLLPGCVGGDDVPVAPTTPPVPSPSVPATPTPVPSLSPTPSPTTTPAAAGTCDGRAVLAIVDAAVTTAGLLTVVGWSPEVAANRFAERTATGEDYADRLGLECGLLATERLSDGDERLLVAAWTGARVAWVVQTSETPATPYAPEATVDVLVGAPEGEWLDEERTTWAGTLDTGETFVVGHAGFSLGAAAKDWFAGLPHDNGPPDDGLLAAERHGITVLEAAGMREVDIAEPAEIGSEEGHLQFVSPTGQISVADVAPAGWFDPMTPRYYDGPTRFETIEGTRVRVTEPGPDAPEYAIAAEVGFACADHVWLLQPPLNGDIEELLATAAAVLDTCRAG